MVNDLNVRESPIRDFLFQLMILDYDISNDDLYDSIFENIVFILEQMGISSELIVYLEYKIKRIKGEYIKIIPENIITALWFSGILPYDCDSVFDKNEIKYDNKIYKFNRKTKKLTWKKIKK
jgi:hypothetical protein